MTDKDITKKFERKYEEYLAMSKLLVHSGLSPSEIKDGEEIKKILTNCNPQGFYKEKNFKVYKIVYGDIEGVSIPYETYLELGKPELLYSEIIKKYTPVVEKFKPSN